MKINLIAFTIGIGILVAAAPPKPTTKLPNAKINNHNKTLNSSKTADIEEIMAQPGNFRKPVKVSGSVTKVYPDKNVFILGCKDSCMTMPVKYKGQMPELKSEITVYGKINISEGGKYFFEAKEIRIK